MPGPNFNITIGSRSLRHERQRFKAEQRAEKANKKLLRKFEREERRAAGIKGPELADPYGVDQGYSHG